MDYQKKKAYLNNYRILSQDITRLEQDISYVREDKTSPSVRYSDMPKASNLTDLSDYIVKLDTLMTKCIRKKQERLDLRMAIREKIESMDDGNEKNVIQCRYLELMKWEDICVYLGYSWQHTHRIHASALKNFPM